jgi:hypothetical protein
MAKKKPSAPAKKTMDMSAYSKHATPGGGKKPQPTPQAKVKAKATKGKGGR